MKNALFKRRRKVRGVLGWITANRAGGWAFNRRKLKKRLTINVRVNNNAVGSVVADMKREGLVERELHPTGECGFVFEFPQTLQPGDKIEAIDARTREHLSGSPGHFRIVTGKAPSPVRGISDVSRELKLFFIHVPKTAGTTFRHMLYEIYAQDKIYPNQELIQSTAGYPPIESFFTLSDEIQKNTELFMGHYPWVLNKLLGTNVCKLVFLRDPVERTISNLNHFKNLNPSHRDLSLMEIWDRAKRHMSNLQTRYFCKSDVSDDISLNVSSEMTEHDLEQAKANLATCEFIGITERFADSIALVNRVFDFDIQCVDNLNVTQKKQEVSDAFREQMHKDNRLDMVLYQLGLEIFEERFRKTS